MGNFMIELKQQPPPGSCLLIRQGDLLKFELHLNVSAKGSAWLRTNIGNANIRYNEIIRNVEEGLSVLDCDWHDLPMDKTGDNCFALELPLSEVGIFAAKAFFVAENDNDPQWPSGVNISIKVESADYCSGNSVYNAFVRQFNSAFRADSEGKKNLGSVGKLDAEGYTVIPPSGTFRDLIRELDFIIGKMKFRIIQLLPIFPVPTTYARMGRFGSPYASLDFFDVDPALAEFDRRTSPLDQFKELVDAVHIRDGRLFLDIPINHTGWASWLQNHHPEWFLRGDDRTFKSPGAWGVTWDDLSELDYSKIELWQYIADVFLFWCDHGVDGFRCDAGYMIPATVWRYIVAKVRTVYPDTIFLLEGLGGGLYITESLLAVEGLDWAYSELFQNYNREEVERYLDYSAKVSATKGKLINFAETHDNDRMAKRSHAYAMMRTALAALCSPGGAFGISNGVEWFADKKINVHGAPSLRWGAVDNQVEHIAILNNLLQTHPAFMTGAELLLVHGTGTGNAIALRRRNIMHGKISRATEKDLQSSSGDSPEHRIYGESRDINGVLVLVNLDDTKEENVSWPVRDFDIVGGLVDLLSGDEVDFEVADGMCRLQLEAAQVFCLASASIKDELLLIKRDQPAEAKIAELYRLGVIDKKGSVTDFLTDPYLFCSDDNGSYVPIVTWRWPADSQRCVMIPPKHLLLIKCSYRFDIRMRYADKVVKFERSIKDLEGSYFILLSPIPDIIGKCIIEFRVYEKGVCKRVRSEVQYIAAGSSTVSKKVVGRVVQKKHVYALCTNGRGAMSQVNGDWGTIQSQYDALLAANLNPSCPDDRHIMFTRCRAWLVYRDYSHELDYSCLMYFGAINNNEVEWKMQVPCGMGNTIGLTIKLHLVKDKNIVMLEFSRDHECLSGCLVDEQPAQLILRPDIEDRNFHTVTKAMHGAEEKWPQSIKNKSDGFVFAPDEERVLSVELSGSEFISEPEWSYMVPHPVEAERGLDGSSDLFSPGYFIIDLKGGEKCVLRAGIDLGDAIYNPQQEAGDTGASLLDAAKSAISPFVVKRDESLTVIAGYPWFLDWGRDTLICLRGMLSADMLKESKEILLQFASFEEGGTLPNMIRGNDQSNRDTSDAPLWFIVSCADLCRQVGNNEFLKTDCGGRSVRDVLFSIVAGYMNGTDNGIKMDAESGLIFSPSHFTWMDTNHPAGTPRVGYPIEIQALWYASLKFMAELTPDGEWKELSEKVRRSVAGMFYNSSDIGLSDCLHTDGYQPAKDAVADDALRPNQLFAITLGLIDELEICRKILNACEALLVPGAIRSLADREVEYPLEVRKADGGLLNDPHRPYWGYYCGDEDTRRKPAYHNGTAWSWVFPSYSEALFIVYGEVAKVAATAVLNSSAELMDNGCIGHIPEIIDGNAPHIQRGCGAQAWGVTELYRVLKLLS